MRDLEVSVLQLLNIWKQLCIFTNDFFASVTPQHTYRPTWTSASGSGSKPFPAGFSVLVLVWIFHTHQGNRDKMQFRCTEPQWVTFQVLLSKRHEYLSSVLLPIIGQATGSMLSLSISTGAPDYWARTQCLFGADHLKNSDHKQKVQIQKVKIWKSEFVWNLSVVQRMMYVPLSSLGSSQGFIVSPPTNVAFVLSTFDKTKSRLGWYRMYGKKMPLGSCFSLLVWTKTCLKILSFIAEA